MEPQSVIFDVFAMHQFEQFGPKLPLERFSWLVADFVPQGTQFAINAAISHTFVTKLGADSDRIWWERGFQCNYAI